MIELLAFGSPTVAPELGAVLHEIECHSMNYAALTSELWLGRAVACLRAMFPVYEFLWVRQDVHFTRQSIRYNFDLDVLEEFAWDQCALWRGKVVREEGYFRKTYGQDWVNAVRPLQTYIKSIPGYEVECLGKQHLKTKDQYHFVVRQLARIWCDRQRYVEPLSNSLPEVPMINRVLVPGMGL